MAYPIDDRAFEVPKDFLYFLSQNKDLRPGRYQLIASGLNLDLSDVQTPIARMSSS
jgi:hypothetical protein